MLKILRTTIYFSFLFSAICSANVQTLELTVADQEFSIDHYPAEGKHLVLWLSSGFETSEVELNTAQRLSQAGVEVWYVDLVNNLFLTRDAKTMRSFRGEYVAELIVMAHQRTGKRVTVIGRAYGAIPALYGAHKWQTLDKPSSDYLNGAILFSPELIQTVPALGQTAEYMPVVSASSLPIMVFQSAKRGNRWQLNELVRELQKNNPNVFVKIFKDVTSVFSDRDTSLQTLQVRQALVHDLISSINLLERFVTPQQALPLKKIKPAQTRGLDISLKKYTANPQPAQLDLLDARGKRLVRKDYRGKVTVVNFWASWCAPCIEEIPSLNNLLIKMKDRPFELISVNYAEDAYKVSLFLQQVKVNFPVLLDKEGKVSAEWNVLVFPSTFVIGPDGMIHYGVNGAIHWDSPEVVKQLNRLYLEFSKLH
ncbi:MAG: redoxin domain-containing protein [Gammaproteobacteria bacterium]